MDFLLNDEQILIRDTIQKYVDKEIIPVAAELDRTHHPLPREILFDFYAKLEPFGYFTALFAEEQGGLNLPYLSFGILMEHLRRGYCSLAGSVGATVATAASLAKVATPEQFEQFVKPVMQGKMICGVGITEPNAGSNTEAMKTKAVRKGDKYILNGSKVWISNGTVADYIIIVANVDEGDGEVKGKGRFIVPTSTPGFTTSLIPKMGMRSYSSAEIGLIDVEVPAENRLQEGDGLDATYVLLNAARTQAAIASVGIGQAAFDIAVKYAKERQQFGRPIAKFQLVQEHIAQMATDLDAARLMTYRAMIMVDSDPKCFKACSMAKAFATEAGIRITYSATQVMGAYGISEEYDAERLYRDARPFTYLDGTTEIHKLIIGREVLGMSAFV